MDGAKELNSLWHIVGMRMKKEMCSGKYPAILGVSMVELSILEVVEQHSSCMMKCVSQELELPKSTLTSAVKRLEQKGYITKECSLCDKRAYNLELTPLGYQAQEEHRNIELFVFKKLLCTLSDEERNHFLLTFNKAIRKSST